MSGTCPKPPTHSPAACKFSGRCPGTDARWDDLESDPPKRMLHQATETGRPGGHLNLPSPKEGPRGRQEGHKGFGGNRQVLAVSRCRGRIPSAWRVHCRTIQGGNRDAGQAGRVGCCPKVTARAHRYFLPDPGIRMAVPFRRGSSASGVRVPPAGFGGFLDTARMPLHQSGLRRPLDLTLPAVLGAIRQSMRCPSPVAVGLPH